MTEQEPEFHMEYDRRSARMVIRTGPRHPQVYSAGSPVMSCIDYAGAEMCIRMLKIGRSIEDVRDWSEFREAAIHDYARKEMEKYERTKGL